jgi:hypothetical protein
MTSWAAPADGHGGDLLKLLQEALPIRLIATPRERFSNCALAEPVSAIIQRNKLDYDYFPVIETLGNPNARIIGLFHAAAFREEPDTQAIVADDYEPLSENNIIGADASVLDFVRGADRQGCQLIVAGQTISGLVSLSDLQQLPVRAALFAAVTHLEMTMTRSISANYARGDWIDMLTSDAATRVRKDIRKSREAHVLVDDLLSTVFKDKIEVLSAGMKGAAKVRFDADMERIRQLRNKLAHAGEYARNRKAAKGVCETVRRLDYWVATLAAATNRVAS